MTLLEITCQKPYLLPNPEICPTRPGNNHQKHPLKKMSLAAFKISGKQLLVKAFRQKLPIASCHLGECQPGNSMGCMSNSGCHFVVKKKFISFVDPNINSILKCLSDLFAKCIGYSTIK